MKQWLVVYKPKPTATHLQSLGEYPCVVVAEDDDFAIHVGFEHLENDDHDPRDFEFVRCSQLEVCHGCGGLRRKSAPEGQGAVHG